MPSHPTLRLCLEPELLKSAKAGQHNFINLIVETVERARFRVEYSGFSTAELFKSTSRNVFTLSHMKPPPSGRGLIFRRAYCYPFWQIDESQERWCWDVAQTTFDPAHVPEAEARKFAGFWKKRLFADATEHATKSGYVYVPLQGKLGAHRSFQSCSPLEMLGQTLTHCGSRKVVATLHPKETYTPADLAALEHLEKRHANLTVSAGEMTQHLQQCDYVVTQNSSVAFAGYFFGKAALFFAGIDFHHIGVRVDMKDLPKSFAAVAEARPDFDLYLWWFLQKQSINAGKETAQAKIAARLKRFGWPLE